MGVYVDGMEMPQDCMECPIVVCLKTADECPLIPVPPHGALIDRDDFFAICPELVNGYKTITDDIVVIPAEEGET